MKESMTFIEAAIEVLKREGRPLHHEKISELAIKYKLLSHIGKNPESIMLTRLSLQTRGVRQQGPILRVKPGIFALAEWKGNPPGPRKPTPEEIAAAEEAEKLAEAAAAEQQEEAKREAKEVRDNKREPRERRDSKRDEERREPREDRKEARDERREPREDRREPREEKRESREDRREPREDRKEAREERREPRRENRRELRAKRRSLIEVAEETLRNLGDARPRSIKSLIQAMPEHQVDASVATAAITADIIRRRAQGLLPTFSFDGEQISLSEWSSRKRAFEIEQELSRVTLEKNEELYKEISEKISSMRGGALEHWVTLALEKAGFGGVRLMRRSSLGNFIVVARATQNLSNAKIVAMVRCNGKEVTAKEVSDLRANTETYRAQSALFISFTGFAENAISEAANQAPAVILWDEKVVARLLASQTSVNHQITASL
jgi:hypothetical protein